MNEKTYRRMTKKRSLRGFKLFKQKYLTKPWLYALLAKIHLVREVKSVLPRPYTNSDTLNKVHLLSDKIKTDRGQFNLSYRAEGVEESHKWWYESLFKKKRLYIITDRTDYHLTVEVRSECEQFLVKINPFFSGTVTRNAPTIQVLVPRVPTVPLAVATKEDMSTTKRITCNFLNARLGITVMLNISDEKDIDDGVRELLNKATAQLHNYIDGNAEEINERLTGIKCDGEFHTAEGKKLIPNCVCRRCSRPVFESSVEGYTAQCLFCDEDLYSIEVCKIDPEMYKDIYELSKYHLYKLLAK